MTHLAEILADSYDAFKLQRRRLAWVFAAGDELRRGMTPNLDAWIIEPSLSLHGHCLSIA